MAFRASSTSTRPPIDPNTMAVTTSVTAAAGSSRLARRA
jgi:hypothetical protein